MCYGYVIRVWAHVSNVFNAELLRLSLIRSSDHILGNIVIICERQPSNYWCLTLTSWLMHDILNVGIQLICHDNLQNLLDKRMIDWTRPTCRDSTRLECWFTWWNSCSWWMADSDDVNCFQWFITKLKCELSLSYMLLKHEWMPHSLSHINHSMTQNALVL
jgi:hypothetical protein